MVAILRCNRVNDSTEISEVTRHQMMANAMAEWHRTCCSNECAPAPSMMVRAPQTIAGKARIM
jgi:NADH:ubiquinone oxidoreductase subunit E